MSNINILHYLTEIIYTYSVYLLTTTFQKQDSKYSGKIQFLVYFLFYFSISYIFSYINIPILTIATNLIGIFAISFLYNKSPLNNLKVSFITYGILILQELIVISIINNPYTNLFKSLLHKDIFSVFLCNITFLISSFIIKYLIKNKRNILLISQIYNIILSIVSIVISIVLITATTISIEAFITISVALVLINLLSVLGYDYITSYLKEQHKNGNSKQQV